LDPPPPPHTPWRPSPYLQGIHSPQLAMRGSVSIYVHVCVCVCVCVILQVSSLPPVTMRGSAISSTRQPLLATGTNALSALPSCARSFFLKKIMKLVSTCSNSSDTIMRQHLMCSCRDDAPVRVKIMRQHLMSS